jgi:hypothetical protein
MNPSLLAALAGAFLITASGTALADPAATPSATPILPAAVPPAQKAKSHPQDEIVCKTIVATGSRLGGTKVCKTRADWYQESNSDREAMDKTQPMNPTVK